MKKDWKNPELKNLSIENTQEDVGTMSYFPIPNICDPGSYDLSDRTTCLFYKNGCTNQLWKENKKYLWPCEKATCVDPS